MSLEVALGLRGGNGASASAIWVLSASTPSSSPSGRDGGKGGVVARKSCGCCKAAVMMERCGGIVAIGSGEPSPNRDFTPSTSEPGVPCPVGALLATIVCHIL